MPRTRTQQRQIDMSCFFEQGVWHQHFSNGPHGFIAVCRIETPYTNLHNGTPEPIKPMCEECARLSPMFAALGDGTLATPNGQPTPRPTVDPEDLLGGALVDFGISIKIE